VKRALWLLPVPVAALALAMFADRPEPPVEHAPAVTKPSPSPPATAATDSTWVAVVPTRTAPRAVAATAAPPKTGPKPPTESRTALMDSRVPIAPALSIDNVGTPGTARERLLAQSRGPSESRQVQLDRLSDRADAYLARLNAQRAQATGEERARIDRDIAAIKRNQAFRARIVTTTGHAPVRPGAR